MPPVVPPIRLPFGPVLDALPGDTVLGKARQVAAQLGLAERSVHRAMARNRRSGVAPSVADEWAALAGRHPSELWPESLWNKAWNKHDAERKRRAKEQRERDLVAKRARRARRSVA